MSFARISTMSASLPGVSVPILFSKPLALAPPMVAIVSTSRTVMGAGAVVSPSAQRLFESTR